jgi:hypothetical protein
MALNVEFAPHPARPIDLEVATIAWTLMCEDGLTVVKALTRAEAVSSLPQSEWVFNPLSEHYKEAVGGVVGYSTVSVWSETSNRASFEIIY